MGDDLDAAELRIAESYSHDDLARRYVRTRRQVRELKADLARERGLAAALRWLREA